MALTLPSIQGDSKINFKIKELKGIYLGVCFKNIQKQNDFNYNFSIKGGFYGVNNNG